MCQCESTQSRLDCLSTDVASGDRWRCSGWAPAGINAATFRRPRCCFCFILLAYLVFKRFVREHQGLKIEPFGQLAATWRRELELSLAQVYQRRKRCSEFCCRPGRRGSVLKCTSFSRSRSRLVCSDIRAQCAHLPSVQNWSNC